MADTLAEPPAAPVSDFHDRYARFLASQRCSDTHADTHADTHVGEGMTAGPAGWRAISPIDEDDTAHRGGSRYTAGAPRESPVEMSAMSAAVLRLRALSAEQAAESQTAGDR